MSFLDAIDCETLPDCETPPDPDLRLLQTQALAESGQFLDAARMAAIIWFGSDNQKGINDVRVVAYLLYGAISEEGVDALPRLVRCVRKLSGEHWDKLYPTDDDDRKAAFSKGMGWLFSKVFAQAVVSEQQRDIAWARLVADFEKVTALLTALRELPESWSDKIEEPSRGQSPARRMLGKLISQLERAAQAPPPLPQGGASREAPIGAELDVELEPRLILAQPSVPGAPQRIPKLTIKLLPLLKQTLTPLPAQARSRAIVRAVQDAQELAQKGHFRAAAAVAARSWSGASEKPQHDVRMLGYLLYGAYLQRGVAALPTILRCLHRILKEDWAALTPHRDKLRQLPAVLGWFLSALCNNLAVSQREAGASWRKLSAQPELLAQLSEGLIKARAAWSLRLRGQPAGARAAPIQMASKLLKFLNADDTEREEIVSEDSIQPDVTSERAHLELESSEPEPRESDAEEQDEANEDGAAQEDAAQEDEEHDDDKSEEDSSDKDSEADEKPDELEDDGDQDQDGGKRNDRDEPKDENQEHGEKDGDKQHGKKDDADEATGDADRTNGEDGDTPSDEENSSTSKPDDGGDDARPSEEFMRQLVLTPLYQLEQRLQAFRTLTERGDHERAAIIALDLQEIIAHFDVRAMFRRVLAEFYVLLSEKSEDFETELEKKGTLRRRALSELYKLDLSAFLKERDST